MQILVSDNGTIFVSKEFESFLNKRGIHHKKSVPYNPASNGMIERYNRDVKGLIQASRFDKRSYDDRLQSHLVDGKDNSRKRN